MAYIFMTYIVLAYVVMAYIGRAYIFMTYIVLAYVVMAHDSHPAADFARRCWICFQVTAQFSLAMTPTHFRAFLKDLGWLALAERRNNAAEAPSPQRRAPPNSETNIRTPTQRFSFSHKPQTNRPIRCVRRWHTPLAFPPTGHSPTYSRLTCSSNDAAAIPT